MGAPLALARRGGGRRLNWIRRLLDRARRRPRRDGTDERPPLEAAVAALLDDYAERLEADPGPVAGTWIFRRGAVDHELYARAFLQLFEEELDGVRASAYERAVEVGGLSCACRCRKHRQSGCPLCLAVEVCPLHASPDPTSLERRE